MREFMIFFWLRRYFWFFNRTSGSVSRTIWVIVTVRCGWDHCVFSTVAVKRCGKSGRARRGRGFNLKFSLTPGRHLKHLFFGGGIFHLFLYLIVFPLRIRYFIQKNSEIFGFRKNLLAITQINILMFRKLRIIIEIIKKNKTIAMAGNRTRI